MDKVNARTLKPWEKHKLKYMKRQLTNSVNCPHARIILLSRGGLNNRQIAAGCGYTPTWVKPTRRPMPNWLSLISAP
jgi:hypothetical protein